MYYQNSYEDYMPNMYGYEGFRDDSPYIQDTYYSGFEKRQNNLENMYPEIYKLVNPMIKRICGINSRPVTDEALDDMVSNISLAIEGENVETTVRMELKNGDVKNPNVKTDVKESRQNNYLNDLIRILLIREFLGRPNNMRPPFGIPPHLPPRPPSFWGRPPYYR